MLSINWAREQYFIGDFDGEKYNADDPEAYPLYVDDGLDYYASRVFQDFDDPDNDDVYTLGWVNTWDYATTAPSTWGKGIWSLPRKLTLYDDGCGLKLRQTPLPNLTQLRKEKHHSEYKLKSGRTPLKHIPAMSNCYELKIRLDSIGPDVAGINLCEGDGRKVTLVYDNQSHYLTLDRTNSSDARIPKFDRISYLKIPHADKGLELTIFVDKSVVEIFVNNGEKVLTLLTFASDGQTGASLFSINGNTKASVDSWQLEPIM